MRSIESILNKFELYPVLVPTQQRNQILRNVSGIWCRKNHWDFRHLKKLHQLAIELLLIVIDNINVFKQDYLWHRLFISLFRILNLLNWLLDLTSEHIEQGILLEGSITLGTIEDLLFKSLSASLHGSWNGLYWQIKLVFQIVQDEVTNKKSVTCDDQYFGNVATISDLDLVTLQLFLFIFL